MFLYRHVAIHKSYMVYIGDSVWSVEISGRKCTSYPEPLPSKQEK